MLKTDPYRWLEKDSKRTRDWLRIQEKETNEYFSHVPLKKELLQEFHKLYDIDIERIPTIRKNKYFFRFKVSNLF